MRGAGMKSVEMRLDAGNERLQGCRRKDGIVGVWKEW
jgi:hypothetical protein